MSQSASAATINLRSALIARPSLLSHASLLVGGTLFLALMAQIAIPVPGSPVPVTGQTLAVLLLGTAYGANLGVSTLALYLLVGIAGAPVFSKGHHGLSWLTGPTGGYLAGMLVAAFITGLLAGRKWDQRITTVIPTMIAGDAIIFTFGLLWLHHATGMSWALTFKNGFTPFILGEFLKIAIASTALPSVWRYVAKR